MAPAALPLLLLLLSGAALAQEVKLVAGPGCAELPPSPPVNLSARPYGDGALLVSWDRPANGACVQEYRVTVLPVDGSQRSAQPPTNTPGFNVTIRGLANGRQHRIYVKAAGGPQFGGAGGEAQVLATPAAPCSLSVLPTAPTGLRATPMNASVTLCWGPPASNGTAAPGCVDEYRVAIRLAQSQSGRSATTAYRRYNSGGCVNISELANNELYEFSVQSYSITMKGGAYASVLSSPVAPPRAWRCSPVPAFYPLCSAAARGLCTPLSCKDQALQGKCNAAFMRVVDASSRTVFQYCADACGCSPDPNLGRQHAATPSAAATPAPADSDAAAPLVQKMDGGVTERNVAAAAAADAAGRTVAAPATASWESPDGCCARKPVSRAFAGLVEEGAEEL